MVDFYQVTEESEAGAREDGEWGRYAMQCVPVLPLFLSSLYLSAWSRIPVFFSCSAEECKQVCWALRDFTRLFR